jgi:hypothetical protein
MTKKDYQVIAEAISNTRDGVTSFENGQETLDRLIENLGFAFRLDNDLFDRDKFRTACQ